MILGMGCLNTMLKFQTNKNEERMSRYKLPKNVVILLVMETQLVNIPASTEGIDPPTNITSLLQVIVILGDKLMRKQEQLHTA